MSFVKAHFIIAGAQRSGTTYLYQVLDEHPAIEMARPLRPEPKFFLDDALVANGLDYYEQTYFAGKASATHRGEKSTSYMESLRAARNIRRLLPRVTLLFLLRHPILRAISNVEFSIQNGFETLDLEEALSREAERASATAPLATSVSPFAYRARGHYFRYLSEYLSVFDRSQVIVLLHESLVGEKVAIQDLYSRLGVEPGYIPARLHERANESTGPRKHWMQLSRPFRTALVEEFEPSNTKLAEQFGVDIAVWKKVDREILDS